MFFKKNEGNQVDKVQRLYIFAIRFENGMEVVKIGKSSGSSSLDRMLQVQRDYFNKNRYTFICRIKRDRKVELDVFKYESEMHRFFSRYQYKCKTPFDGSTELFVIDIRAAIEALDYLLNNGLGSLDEFEYDPEVYRDEVDELPF